MRKAGLVLVASLLMGPAVGGSVSGEVLPADGPTAPPDAGGGDLGPVEGFPAREENHGPLDSDEGCQERPPIRIRGDAMLKLGPAVGVRNPAAAGTEEDPYVIEGWCIHGGANGPPAEAGIHVAGTREHVEVRANVVDGSRTPFPFWHGIEVRDARNVTVVDNTVTGNLEGITVGASTGTMILENEVVGNDDGIDVQRSDGTVVAGNNVSDNERGGGVVHYGLFVYDSDGIEVAGNEFQRNEYGVILEGTTGARIVGNNVTDHPDLGAWVQSDDVVVADNRLTGNRVGVFLQKAHRGEVRGNVVEGNEEGGVGLDRSPDARVANNSIADNADGVHLDASGGTEVVDNEIADNGDDGIDVRNRPDTSIHRNNIRGNGDAGLELRNMEDAVDATGNWWGASDGPGGGVEDACTGTVAVGGGDPIETRFASACFDPWLSSPNPEAGPG